MGSSAYVTYLYRSVRNTRPTLTGISVTMKLSLACGPVLRSLLDSGVVAQCRYDIDAAHEAHFL